MQVLYSPSIISSEKELVVFFLKKDYVLYNASPQFVVWTTIAVWQTYSATPYKQLTKLPSGFSWRFSFEKFFRLSLFLTSLLGKNQQRKGKVG